MKIDARSLHRAWRMAREAGLDVFRPGIASELPRLAGWGLDVSDLVYALAALQALLHFWRETTNP